MKVKKKLAVAISSLILTMILATGSTFAWISINNRATVENFNIEMSSNSNALTISVDGKNYYNTLSTDTLMHAMGLVYEGSKISVANFTAYNGLTYYTAESKAALIATNTDKQKYEFEEPFVEGLHASTDSTDDKEVTTTTFKIAVPSDRSVTNGGFSYLTKGQAQDSFNDTSAGIQIWYDKTGTLITESAKLVAANYYKSTIKHGTGTATLYQAVTATAGTAWTMNQVTYLKTADELKDTGKTEGFYTLAKENEAPNLTYTAVKSNFVKGGRYLSVPLYFRSNARIAQEVYMFDTSITPVKSSNEQALSAVKYGKEIIKAGRGFADNDAFGTFYGSTAVKNFLVDNSDKDIGNTVYSRAAYAARIGFNTPTGMKIYDPYKTATITGGIANPSFYVHNFARDVSAVSYFSTVTGADDLYPTAVGDDITVNAEKEEVKGGTSLFKLANSANGYFEYKIDLNIWLEGRDGDCFSGVIGDDFNVKLSFIALPKGTEQNPTPAP